MDPETGLPVRIAVSGGELPVAPALEAHERVLGIHRLAEEDRSRRVTARDGI